jgi:hypothetical protein
MVHGTLSNSYPPLTLGVGKIDDFLTNMYNQADRTVKHYLNNLLQPQNFKFTFVNFIYDDAT